MGMASRVGAAQAATETDSASVYKANCSLCHGDDGAGTALGARFKVVDLRNKDVKAKSTADMAQTIREGKGNMPAFGKRLDGDQIDKLVAYVRGLKPKPE